MVTLLIQLAIVTLWGVALSRHTRRLLRLARVELRSESARHLRQNLERVWWWLGREEYWRAVQQDGLRCSQLTVMVFLLVWGAWP